MSRDMLRVRRTVMSLHRFWIRLVPWGEASTANGVTGFASRSDHNPLCVQWDN